MVTQCFQVLKQSLLLWQTFSGSLSFGLGAIAPATSMQSQVNPLPSIVARLPSLRSNSESSPIPLPSLPISVPETLPLSPSSFPLPEEQQTPVTEIRPINGKVNARLINKTNASIRYQAIGSTQPRILNRRSEILLRDLPVAVTLTFRRPDGGLLQIMTQPVSTTGTLEVTFKETTDLRADTTALVLEETGRVFLY